MQRGISALCFVALMDCAAAEAPAPTPAAAPMPAAVEAPTATAGTRFDGTYAFVSFTKLSETFFSTRSTHVYLCPDRPMSALTVVNGRARSYGYGRWTAAGFNGTVGPRGELAMRLVPQPVNGNLPIEIKVQGKIDGNGTVTARQTGPSCRYDVVWRKQSQ